MWNGFLDLHLVSVDAVPLFEELPNSFLRPQRILAGRETVEPYYSGAKRPTP
jgi:hypothetical protein